MKWRKFADKQRTIKQRTKNRQTNGSKTEPTLILCGYSGERAINNRGECTTERRMRRRKMRKFAYKQAIKEQADRHRIQTLGPL